jgi:hypothetical protein
MVAVPADIPVTSPVEALIVATAGALLIQLPPETVEPKVVVPVTQILWFPLRVPAAGGGLMVTDRVAVAFAQPPVSVTV